MVLLGALMALGRLPFAAEEVLEVIRSRTNPKFLESNLTAFELGAAAAREAANWRRRFRRVRSSHQNYADLN